MTDVFLFVCQRAADGRVHAKEAPVQGALPAPLLLLQDPRPQTRLHCSLRPLPPLADAHHCRQELPGESWQKMDLDSLFCSSCVASQVESCAITSEAAFCVS